jgi:hypothetical protein
MPISLNLIIIIISWISSASELYRPSDSHFSAKLVPTFAVRGASRSQRGGSPTAVISVLYTGVGTFPFKHVAPQLYSRG